MTEALDVRNGFLDLPRVAARDPRHVSGQIIGHRDLAKAVEQAMHITPIGGLKTDVLPDPACYLRITHQGIAHPAHADQNDGQLQRIGDVTHRFHDPGLPGHMIGLVDDDAECAPGDRRIRLPVGQHLQRHTELALEGMRRRGAHLPDQLTHEPAWRPFLLRSQVDAAGLRRPVAHHRGLAQSGRAIHHHQAGFRRAAALHLPEGPLEPGDIRSLDKGASHLLFSSCYSAFHLTVIAVAAAVAVSFDATDFSDGSSMPSSRNSSSRPVPSLSIQASVAGLFRYSMTASRS